MKYLFYKLLFLLSFTCVSQNYNEKKRNFFGTFHTQNTTINGIAFGAFPRIDNEKRFVRTNGIRIEAPGMGLLLPLIPRMPKSFIPDGETDEIVNGINISGGTMGTITYNGITLGLFGQIGIKNNGFAIAGLLNAMNKSNGLQISGLYNEANHNNGIQVALSNITNTMIGMQLGGFNTSREKMIGIQLGLFNSSNNTRGIQLGFWNENEKRKFPIINWNFKS